MKTLILAAALSAAAAGAAFAQEAPYTVMNGQVKYPGQMQWNAPVGPMAGDMYYGDASASIPGGYVTERGFIDGYERDAPGIFVFEGENLNSDQNYSGK